MSEFTYTDTGYLDDDSVNLTLDKVMGAKRELEAKLPDIKKVRAWYMHPDTYEEHYCDQIREFDVDSDGVWPGLWRVELRDILPVGLLLVEYEGEDDLNMPDIEVFDLRRRRD